MQVSTGTCRHPPLQLSDAACSERFSGPCRRHTDHLTRSDVEPQTPFVVQYFANVNHLVDGGKVGNPMYSARSWAVTTTVLTVLVLLPAPTTHGQDKAPEEGMFEEPAPPRHNRDWYRDEDGHWTRRYPRQFDMRRQFYRDGYGYRFGIPSIDQVREEDLDRAYRQGVEDGRALERREVQAERGIGAYELAMSDGQAAFESRAYGLAARHLLLAATLNQGDPASRLAAAHAQTALGEYASAARLVRRAFELQPRLVYLPLDIRNTYADAAEFNAHIASLRGAASNENEDADLRFLLGYYYYYSDNMTGAASEFSRAAKLDPADALYPQLAELARMSAPRSKEVSRRQSGPNRRGER